MTRDSVTEALILACREALPGSLSVTMLARAESGADVRQAVLFGGRKSRLRALVSPWHTGRVWLYGAMPDSPPKITDFDPQKYRPSFREHLYKAHTASLVSEVLIKTKAAGGAAQCWRLVNAFFDGLEAADERAAGAALIRFLWRYLDILGLRPSPDSCAVCGGALAPDALLPFLPEEHGFLCARCGALSPPQRGGDYPALTGEARAYLQAVSSLPAAASRALPLSPDGEARLTRFLFALITAAAGERLKTLEVSAGVFP